MLIRVAGRATPQGESRALASFSLFLSPTGDVSFLHDVPTAASTTY